MRSVEDKELGDSGVETPDLPNPTRDTKVQWLKTYLAAEVTTTHGDILLLACCLISGFVDSTLYNAFYTFVSMQTGNTIFVGLGASGQNARPFGWARSLMSIACFMLGSIAFSRLNHLLGPLRRGTLFLSFLLQTLMIFVAASLIESDDIDGHIPVTSFEVRWNQLAPIALLSFQAAGQIVGSRALGYGELPTVVITSLLCDLFSDRELLAPISANVKRNRRVLGFILTLIGAIAGGWVSKASKGVQSSLWVAGSIKFAITFLWMLWSREDSARSVV